MLGSHLSNLSDATHILEAVQASEPQAAEELLALVYDELRRLAAQKMAQERQGQTLQATALVHETWLRVYAQKHARWQNREQFYAVAAETMRRILIERARRRMAAKRGGRAVPLGLEAIEIAVPDTDETLLELHEALDLLAEAHPQKAELVKLRYFAGLTFEETARVLGIAVPTAKQWWAYARAWLRTTIARQRELPPATTAPPS